MFIDETEVILKAGHGGAGKVSFYPGLKAGPDGGNGGKGGDVYLEGTSDLTALKQFTSLKTISAQNGSQGQSNRKSGPNGQDKTVILPIGSVLINQQTNQELEVQTPNQKILICEGGLGGRGNFEFKSSVNTTPMRAQPGLPGEEKHFKIILKLTADFGLIGLPNAGKSSLLNELTNANVKTANYPFTTLEPNLGVLDGKILADIPGLIEGASEGKGLGIKFLKHIEKTGELLHCISAESENIENDYQTVIKELESFNPTLLQKPQIIIITKTDLVSEEKLKDQIKILKRYKLKIIPVSIHNFYQIENLKKNLVN